MITWIRRQQEEIAADRVLRIYGACLAAVELLTAYWLKHRHFDRMLAPGTEPICWPIFPDCYAARVFPPWALDGFAVLLALLAVAAAVAFWRRPRLGWWLLLAAEALKLAIVFQDFRLRENQHYMAFFAIATFLFVPDKRRALRYLIILFYFWAGTLKLNHEWLSGSALYRPVWFFTGRLLPVVCAYVVVMELVLVWGLLSRRAVIFWATLGQLALFHTMSWAVVGFFYPLLMAGILAIYPLDRWLPVPAPRRAPFRQERATTWALLAGFCLLQLVPTAVFRGDTTITGEGRLFSLHMFDARIACNARVQVHDLNGNVVNMFNITMPSLPIRIACDPVVYFDRARTLCRKLAPEGLDLDLRLDSRHSTETEMRHVVAVDQFCTHQPTYSMWRPNPWILK